MGLFSQKYSGRTNEGQMVKGRSYKAFLFREWETTQFSEKERDQACILEAL